MAKSADADSVNERDLTNLDWNKAIEIISETIHGIESDQRSLSADAKDAWERVENLGINKVGAQTFSKILKKPVEKRRDEFRTFYMLAKAAGWFDWLQDLVDRAQGAETPPPPAAPAAPAAPKAIAPAPPAHPSDDSDLAGDEPRPTRVNLKTGWLQRLKADTPDNADDLVDADWEDVRQATPEEMAKARDAMAMFDDRDPGAAPKVEPEVEAAKGAARKKTTAKK